MKEENDHLTPEDELRLQNEIKKVNLEINHGAVDFFSSNELPPELEAMFLDNVANFEKNYADGKLISVYDFLGKPDFLKTEDVEDFEKEIERLFEIFTQKQVSISRPERLKAKGYYDFLITDFFQHQMTDYSVDGMIHGFLYSEFRHDEPEFIHAHVEDFLLRLFNLHEDFEYEWISENCRSHRSEITKEEAFEKVYRFREQYEELIPIAFQKEEFIFEKGFMYMTFGIAWDGKLKGAAEVERQEGLGICQLQFEDKEWRLQGVQIPGFVF